MPVFVEHFVVVGDKQEAQQAAERWRFIPKAWKPYYEIPDPVVIEGRAKAEVPLESVHRDWPVSPDADVHVEALTRLFDSGVTSVLVHSGQADQMRVIEFYGTQVFPRLARTAAAK
jgi:hypothetical protein